MRIVHALFFAFSFSFSYSIRIPNGFRKKNTKKRLRFSCVFHACCSYNADRCLSFPSFIRYALLLYVAQCCAICNLFHHFVALTIFFTYNRFFPLSSISFCLFLLIFSKNYYKSCTLQNHSFHDNLSSKEQPLALLRHAVFWKITGTVINSTMNSGFQIQMQL